MSLEACCSNEFSETFLYIGNPDVNSVYREMTHSRCDAAGKCDTRRRSSQIQPRTSNITFSWSLLPDILGAHWPSARDGKRIVICGATPFLQLRLNLVLSVHDFTFSWHCVNFGMLLQLNGKGGTKKVPAFGLTVVLIASCSLFHVLPWGESNLTTFPIVSTGYIHNPTVVRINWRARCE